MSIRSIAAVLALTACSFPETSPRAANPTQPAQPAPPAVAAQPGQAPARRVVSLRGSNTMGIALVPNLVRAFLAAKGATDIQLGTESRSDNRVWIHANLAGPLSIEVWAPGSTFGFQSLEKGYNELVLSSRPITDDEAHRPEAAGDLTAPGNETVVAMDGIAVVVHPNNRIDRLTTEQLEKIFSGEITSWADVGGLAKPIRVLARDQISGTRDAFVSLV